MTTADEHEERALAYLKAAAQRRWRRALLEGQASDRPGHFDAEAKLLAAEFASCEEETPTKWAAKLAVVKSDWLRVLKLCSIEPAFNDSNADATAVERYIATLQVMVLDAEFSERAKIVAWLRGKRRETNPAHTADAIERKEHDK